MVERRQLPPQIKRIELARRAGGRPVVRYQLTVDVGTTDGKRKQLRKRYATERDAPEALDEIRGEVAKGTYVHPSALTVEEACANWLMSRHGIKPKTQSGYEGVLAPVRAALGRGGSPKLAPVGPAVSTNFGPTWVVIMPAGGARRVFTNSGPTPDCDLHVWFLGVEVASGEVAREAFRADPQGSTDRGSIDS